MMTVRKKMAILFVVDLFIVWFSACFAYFIRFSGHVPDEYTHQMVVYSLIASLLCVFSMVVFGMYRKMWQYASVREIMSMFGAVTLSWAISYIVELLVLDPKVPGSVAVWTLETNLLLFGGARVCWRLYTMRGANRGSDKMSTLIFGAGDCGALIAREFIHAAMSDHKLVGFLDDDASKHHLTVHGLPVFGGKNAMLEVASKYNVKEIIIAMPSAPKTSISQIINLCIENGIKTKIIPGINDLVKGKVSINTIRDVDVEDLLGRDAVKIDLVGIAEYVQDKVVLVTGAGGSIGSELCRQIAAFSPSKLLLLGHGENSIYNIQMELNHKYPLLHIEALMADIQDCKRIDDVFREHKPQVVFHAAAHKHVPLMEKNPSEAVKNNVFGTQNVANSADKYGTERFVLISSDKAVNPTSVMGATKRIAEMYVQSLNAHSKTRFASVRFGNVLGSRGSVIPRFKEQIARGGPVTVTHPDMVRYFMTIPEAVQLVIQAGAISKGGEIFILDMGEPVKIVKLAENLIKLSGYEPYVDIELKFTGIRDGEKLFEELLTKEEGITATQHQRIFIGSPEVRGKSDINFIMARLERVVSEDNESVKFVIEDTVPNFHTTAIKAAK